MKVAVVGHTEWIDFVTVSRLPAQGEIVHAREAHEGAGGGGAMAARALRALAGACAFYCALGDDERGAASREDLEAAGITVHAAVRRRAQRRGVTWLDAEAERTITIIGERIVPHGADPLPWEALGECDGVYFTGGDVAALRAARAARVVVATPRARDTVTAAGVTVDALVGSAGDRGEVMGEDLRATARVLVQTRGARGGSWRAADGATGTWRATPLPGTPADAYGCGDSFAAALTYGLAAELGVRGACELAARVGATVLCQRAPAVGDLGRLL